jgi:hypothetical protein
MPEQSYVARLRALSAAASPGPWSHDHDTIDAVDWTCEIADGNNQSVFLRGVDYWKAHDLDLIVFLRNHADEIAAALEALAGLTNADPVEENPIDLTYRCCFCKENGGHAKSCPWQQGRRALFALDRMGTE